MEKENKHSWKSVFIKFSIIKKTFRFFCPGPVHKSLVNINCLRCLPSCQKTSEMLQSQNCRKKRHQLQYFHLSCGAGWGNRCTLLGSQRRIIFTKPSGGSRQRDEHSEVILHTKVYFKARSVKHSQPLPLCIPIKSPIKSPIKAFLGHI